MPIYEYRCEHGHTFEVMQRMSDDPVVACETCDAPVQRIFHPIAVHFKGSGFYNTDYGKRNRTREGGDGGSDEKGAKGKSDGKDKSDAKDSGASKSGTKSETKSSSAAPA